MCFTICDLRRHPRASGKLRWLPDAAGPDPDHHPEARARALQFTGALHLQVWFPCKQLCGHVTAVSLVLPEGKRESNNLPEDIQLEPSGELGAGQ